MPARGWGGEDVSRKKKTTEEVGFRLFVLFSFFFVGFSRRMLYHIEKKERKKVTPHVVQVVCV